VQRILLSLEFHPWRSIWAMSLLRRPCTMRLPFYQPSEALSFHFANGAHSMCFRYLLHIQQDNLSQPPLSQIVKADGTGKPLEDTDVVEEHRLRITGVSWGEWQVHVRLVDRSRRVLSADHILFRVS
jgi:hypothetical protein